MPRVLVTAFDTYAHWKTNASWLALVELAKDLPSDPQITTRKYPVDFAEVRARLERDLDDDYDYALHLGQAPGTGRILLEAIGVNIGGSSKQLPEDFQPLVPGGPAAYRSELPLAEWSAGLRESGIPAQVSYHAGTFLCNATLYLTHYFAEQKALKVKAAFVHLPLDVSQATAEHQNIASLPAEISAAAIRQLLANFSRGGPTC